MSDQHNSAILSSGLAFSQAFYDIELLYNTPAAGTPFPLIMNQAMAQNSQWLLVGTGAVSLSAATAQILAAPINGAPIATDPGASNLAVGMVTYFTNLPAPAPVTACIGFIISGVQFSDYISSELIVTNRESSVAVNPSRIIGNYNIFGPKAFIQEPITLDGSNRLLQNPNDPASFITVANAATVLVPSRGIVFGVISTIAAADAPSMAGPFPDVVTLKVRLTP